MNMADQCVDVESKKRGRKPGSTKAALEAAKKAKSEILAQLTPVLAPPADPTQGLLTTDVLDPSYGHVPLPEEVYTTLAQPFKTVELASFSSPFARSLNATQPGHAPSQLSHLMDDVRNAAIFLADIQYSKDLGLIVKIAVSNIDKSVLHGLRLSLFFVRPDTKEPDRPNSIHLLNQEGKIYKDITSTFTEAICDAFSLLSGESRLFPMALQFTSFVRRDVHFVLKIAHAGATSPIKDVMKEERVPIMLLHQCDGYRMTPTRTTKGFSIGVYAIKADLFRKIFNIPLHEPIAAGDYFYLNRGTDIWNCLHGSESFDIAHRRFLLNAEVRRVEEAVVDFELFQGPGEGAAEVVAELRSL